MGDIGFTPGPISPNTTLVALAGMCFWLWNPCHSPSSALDDAYRSELVVSLLIGHLSSCIGFIFAQFIVPGPHLDYYISVVWIYYDRPPSIFQPRHLFWPFLVDF